MRFFYLLLFVCGAWIGVHVEQLERHAAAESVRNQHRIPSAALALGSEGRRLFAAAERHDIAVTDDPEKCRNNELLGLYTAGRQHIVLCMEKIRSSTGTQAEYQELLQRVFAHELVHAAQDCQSQAGRDPSLGIPEADLHRLSADALAEVDHSLRMIGPSRLPRAVRWRQEAEAQALEANPSAVVAALDAVCTA